MSDVVVESLHLYPVKGCAGIGIDTVRVATTGLALDGAADREWMIVDETGRFLTQRELPRLAQVRTGLVDGRLRLAAPHMPTLVLGDAPVASSRDVAVWRSNVRGIDAGDTAAHWLSDWLALEVRLLRFDRTVTRLCNPEFAGDSGAHTYFADGYPVLVIGAASLDDLNARLAGQGEPALPMNRFRPNIVLRGLEAFEEDHVDTFTIGDATLRIVKPCTRCQVTTTDQVTAVVGIEPLRTLGEYRMHESAGGLAFGQNAIVIREGMIATGMPVAVDFSF